MRHTILSHLLLYSLIPADITVPVIANTIGVVVMGTGEFHSRVHVSNCIYGYWVVETKVGDAVPLLSILIAGSIAHILAVQWERKICNLN